MNYINTETKIAHSEADIRALYPLTSFTHPFVPPEGFAVIFPAPPPAYDTITQFAREIAPELTVKGTWEQRWELASLDAEAVAANRARAASATREAAKARRTAAVAAITVTTAAGNTFDGDETSQGRMARAILALQSTGTPSTPWVLHDNSVIEASAAELGEALALAGAAQSALWMLP
jgi:hypothetical protein